MWVFLVSMSSARQQLCAGLRACQISQIAQMHTGLSEKELHNQPVQHQTGGSEHPTHLTDRWAVGKEWAKRKHFSNQRAVTINRHLSPLVIFQFFCPATASQVETNVGAWPAGSGWV